MNSPEKRNKFYGLTTMIMTWPYPTSDFFPERFESASTQAKDFITVLDLETRNTDEHQNCFRLRVGII
jgi:hypothetical protein